MLHVKSSHLSEPGMFVKLFFVVDEAGVEALADSRGRLDEQQMACYLCELELCCCDHFTNTSVHPLSWSLKLNMS